MTKQYSIYLAGPIAGCTDEEMNGWRTLVKKAAPQHKYFDPCQRDFRHEAGGKEKLIVELDKAEIDASDIVIAHCKKIGSGTMTEIIYAWGQGKRVISVVGSPVSPWIRYHSFAVVQTEQEALTVIDMIAATENAIWSTAPVQLLKNAV